MSYGQQGAAASFRLAARCGLAAITSSHSINPSLGHGAIVRRTGCDNHVQVIPR